jgi:hypothetical protein
MAKGYGEAQKKLVALTVSARIKYPQFRQFCG